MKQLEIRILVTEDQMGAISRHAAKHNKTISSWARGALLRAMKHQKKGIKSVDVQSDGREEVKDV